MYYIEHEISTYGMSDIILSVADFRKKYFIIRFV